MWQLLIVVTICSHQIPYDLCTPRNGDVRAVVRYAAEPGIIVCGLPSTMAASATAPDHSEYARIRCELRRKES